METLQWTMEIPNDKQHEFIVFYQNTLSPTWKKFGARECILYKCITERINGINTFPTEQFIETLVLQDGLTADKFFDSVKSDEEAWEISRQYEKRFGAKNIVMKVLRRIF